MGDKLNMDGYYAVTKQDYEDLEQQLANVGSINLRLMEKLAELREAAQAAVDEWRTSIILRKMLALEELLKEHQDGS